MKLKKLGRAANLRYFSQTTNPISVYENQYYRWLNFDSTTQSIMNRRAPERLTLPHQIYMLLPFAFLSINSITEIGLGGGNLARFLLSHQPEISFSSIETNQTVIDCFNQLFNPTKLKFEQINTNFNQLNGFNINRQDWLIYDIFNRIDSDNITLLSQFLALFSDNNQSCCISINIPQSTPIESAKIEQQLISHRSDCFCIKFTVPKFQNTIYHLIKKSALHNFLADKEQLFTNLPNYQTRRWLDIWYSGLILTS